MVASGGSPLLNNSLRHASPLGAQLSGGECSAPTEPAGETVSSRGDDGRGYFGGGPAGPEGVNRGSIIPFEPLLHEAEAERTLMGGRGRSPLKTLF